jgi:hypothetical protein
MRFAKLLLCMVLMMALAGCDSSDSVVGSVQPLFTPGDLVFDSALAGVWTDGDESDSTEAIVLRPHGENGYTMIVRDGTGREEARYGAWMVNLHGEVYLDILPEAPAVSPQNFKLNLSSSQLGNQLAPRLVPVADQLVMSVEADDSGESGRAYKTRFIRLHWFYKVQTDGRIMRLTGLDPGWLRDEVQEGRILIDHQGFGEDPSGFVLTASTSDLQQLVLDHSFDAKAFPADGASEYQRAAAE